MDPSYAQFAACTLAQSLNLAEVSGALGRRPTIVLIGVIIVVLVPLIIAGPAIAQIVASSATVIDVPRQLAPVRDTERFAQINSQKAGDTIQHVLRWHGLQIRF